MKAARGLTANGVATRALAGLALGQLIVIALDAATGGPGPFVLFGL
ncbi:hypothetical protein [Sphingomonas phyllosphaerae]|nr:hypothetical protein [Sphingomonas phyllosphaerae]